MKAPGSPSSPLQMRYFGAAFSLAQAAHFLPVGNPAPPRPRSPEKRISSMISWGFIPVRALAMAS